MPVEINGMNAGEDRMRETLKRTSAATALFAALAISAWAQPAPRPPAGAPTPSASAATTGVPEAEAAMRAMHARISTDIARGKYSEGQIEKLWFTDELRKLLAAVQNNSKGDVQYAIDSDIILSAQDIPKKHVVGSISSTRKSDTEAIVVVSTDWIEGDYVEKNRVFDYKVKKTAKGWRIDDITYPPIQKGDSRGTLRGMLGAAQKSQRQSR